MILIGNLLRGVATILGILIDVSILLLIVRALVSWLGQYRMGAFGTFVIDATEPVLAKVRQKIPPMGSFDLAAFVLILVLIFLKRVLVDSMDQYGVQFLSQSF